MTRNKESGMENAQAMVKAFHRMFDIVIQEAPAPIDDRTHALRIRLIHEEFEELKEAMAKNDLAGIAKEMADLLYVVYGTAVSYGIDMDPVFREVHRTPVLYRDPSTLSSADGTRVVPLVDVRDG